jgi:hypothetical protein
MFDRGALQATFLSIRPKAELAAAGLYTRGDSASGELDMTDDGSLQEGGCIQIGGGRCRTGARSRTNTTRKIEIRRPAAA